MNCPFCGRERKEGAAFCIYCGNKYSEAESQAPVSPATATPESQAPENPVPAPVPMAPVPETPAPETPVPEAPVMPAQENPVLSVQEQSKPAQEKEKKKKNGNNSGKKKKLPVIIAAAVGGLILLALIAVGVLGYLNYKSIEITIDTDKLDYDEFLDYYSVGEEWNGFKGNINCMIPIGMSNLSFNVKDANGVVISSGEATVTDKKWVVKNPGLMVGKNEFTVALKMYFFFDFEQSIEIFNFDESYLKKVDISLDETDGDGLFDYYEECIGTDINKKDTDSDGLMDYDEYILCPTDPTKYSSRDDGVSDYDYDSDGDGLTNGEEIELGTYPASDDSDGDGLADGDEHVTVGTDPMNYDTDEDGASDGWEVEHGYDPLTPDSSFTTSVSCESTESAVSASVQVETGSPEGLSINEVVIDGILDSSIPGYIGSAFDFHAPDSFDSATISFSFDEGTLAPGAQPTIYYWNEETQMLEEIATSVSGNVASANVSHFSTYILLDKTQMNLVVDEDIMSMEEINAIINQIVFVIDYSQSMDDNDPEGMRLEVAKEYLTKMRNGKDYAAVVQFEATATPLVHLSQDLEMSSNAIDGITNSDGVSGCADDKGTNGSDGLRKALDEFEEFTYEPDYTYNKYIIFLTDGEDNKFSYYYNDLMGEALINNIKIFTVGMGQCDVDLLKMLAEVTGGKYHYASAMDYTLDGVLSLGETFAEIVEDTVDYTSDSNNDGISDYHTKLICEGKLRTATGSSPFGGCSFDEVQATDDIDGDGLINGAEVEVKAQGNYVYMYYHSSPIVADTDGDGTPDGKDERVLKWDVRDRDLLIFSALAYLDGKKAKGAMYSSKTKDVYSMLWPYISFESEAGRDDRGKVIHGDDYWITKRWTVVDFENEFAPGGGKFSATTFMCDDNIVIAYRGSTNEAQENFILEWVDNINGYGIKNCHTEEEQARKYISRIVNQYSGYKVYVTGHSLGGYLAQIGTAELLENTKVVPESVAYFNGMGINFQKNSSIVELVRNLEGVTEVAHQNELLHYNDIEYLKKYAQNHDLISYEMRGDFVSALGTDYGKLLRNYVMTKERAETNGFNKDEILHGAEYLPGLLLLREVTIGLTGNRELEVEYKDFCDDYGFIDYITFVKNYHELNSFGYYLKRNQEINN